MDKSAFTKRFSAYSNEDLLRILKNPDQYQAAALETARDIIKKRNLTPAELESAERNIKDDLQDPQDHNLLKNVISKVSRTNDLRHVRHTAFILREFLRNLLTTFILLLVISFLPMVIEGGLEGYIWGLLFKGVPFLILSFLNSFVFLILDFLKSKSNDKLSFLPTAIFLGYIIIDFSRTEKNYGSVVFVLGILFAILISNYSRFRKTALR